MHKASIEVIKNGGSAGIDNINISDFNKNYKTYMRELYREFKEDRYTPKPVLRVFIPKGDGRKRSLGIPTVKDRIAQATLKRILEPIFEKVFCDCSYGFRPGRSQMDVIEKVEEYHEQGYKVVRFADDFVVMAKSTTMLT
ncbi:MAG: reverse transcriptase domain-containing protein [Bacillota bacterium]